MHGTPAVRQAVVARQPQQRRHEAATCRPAECRYKGARALQQVQGFSCSSTSTHEIMTEDDVLGGRGGRVYRHPGNIRYLGIVAEYAIRYRECGGDNLQNIISETIVNNIFEQGGRFLRWEAGVQSWRVMSLVETHRKVMSALRDAS